MKAFFRIGIILLTALILSRCYDKSVFDEETYNFDLGYYASFAVPIGELDIPVSDLIRSFTLAEDTLGINDNQVDFIFEEHVYNNPWSIDTVLYFDFALSDLSAEIENIKELTIRLNIFNGLPFEMAVRPELVSSISSPFIQLNFDNDIHIPPAPIDNNGNVTGLSTSWDNDFYFNPTQIQALQEVRYVSAFVRLNTLIDTPLEFIELDSAYQFKIQIAAKFTVQKNLDF